MGMVRRFEMGMVGNLKAWHDFLAHFVWESSGTLRTIILDLKLLQSKVIRRLESEDLSNILTRES